MISEEKWDKTGRVKFGLHFILRALRIQSATYNSSQIYELKNTIIHDAWKHFRSATIASVGCNGFQDLLQQFKKAMDTFIIITISLPI